MIKIIAPTQFKQLPWKNGKGVTTELAINSNGNQKHFAWRLSIASVSENGVFSDFSGYERNLILIEGKGLRLEHHLAGQDKQTHKLDQLLDFSNFDGAANTEAFLNAGAIKDFNIITDPKQYDVQLVTWVEHQRVEVEACDLCFVYSLDNTVDLYQSRKLVEQVPATHLVQLVEPKGNELSVQSSNCILVKLKKIG